MDEIDVVNIIEKLLSLKAGKNMVLSEAEAKFLCIKVGWDIFISQSTLLKLVDI